MAKVCAQCKAEIVDRAGSLTVKRRGMSAAHDLKQHFCSELCAFGASGYWLTGHGLAGKPLSIHQAWGAMKRTTDGD